MIFVVYTPENDESIKTSLGAADYSYYFVLKSYVPILNKLGTVFILNNLDEQAKVMGRLYRDCQLCGEPLVFLSFTPPHFTKIDCPWPSLAVFAWEYSVIPQEAWGGNSRNDWRVVLARQGLAITHSQFSVNSVREAMGSDYPIVSVPAPVWDEYQGLYQPRKQPARRNARPALNYHGCLLDSRSLELDDLSPGNRDERIPELVARYGEPKDQVLNLEGVVYTAVLNPLDGRKNWTDLLWAFCWSFRHCRDVTLVIKATYFEVVPVWAMFLWELYRWQPFECRIVIMHGYLEDSVYKDLIRLTDFSVNAAYGEGQCLPLMEFMSAGIPSIAPNHTALADYINENNAFIVKSSPEWIHLPHAPDLSYRTLRYRIDWESLCQAYLASYETAVNSPAEYAAMSERAHQDSRNHCSREVAENVLGHFFRDNKTLFLSSGLRALPAKIMRALGAQNKIVPKYSSLLQHYKCDTGAT